MNVPRSCPINKGQNSMSSFISHAVRVTLRFFITGCLSTLKIIFIGRYGKHGIVKFDLHLVRKISEVHAGFKLGSSDRNARCLPTRVALSPKIMKIRLITLWIETFKTKSMILQ